MNCRMSHHALQAKRKLRRVVLAIIATQELRRRLVRRAKYSTVFSTSDKKYHSEVPADFDAKRKFRGAVYVVIASNEIKHWIDSQETLLHDPTLLHIVHKVTKARTTGEKFNPRRSFKAAVYAVMFVNELEYWGLDLDTKNFGLLPSKVREQVALRSHVKELLGWLGQHPSRPSFVHQFYRDLDMVHHGEPAASKCGVLDKVPSRNPRRKFRSAIYTGMAVNKMEKNLRRQKLKMQIRDRFDWFSKHRPSKVVTKRPHNVHFEDPRDEATVPIIHERTKDFQAKRKALGDIVVVHRAGMLPKHELHRSYSTE